MSSVQVTSEIMSKYIEGQDWGYYIQENENCTRCMETCLNDGNCVNLEGQDNSLNQTDGYCAWWSKDRCSDESELTIVGNGKAKTCFHIG